MNRRPVAGALLCLAGFLALRFWVAEPISVDSVSMAPTVSPGSTIWLDKLTPRLACVRPGELVIFRSPGDGELVLKRVVATSGQEVAMRDGVLYVDDIPAMEPFVDQSTIDGVYFGTVRVDDGELFVLGDNREESIDSRHYGSIRADSVEAVAIGIR